MAETARNVLKFALARLTSRTVLIDQACETLGVSRRTVYYWISAGRLNTVRTLGGSQRILTEDLLRVVRTRAAMEEAMESRAMRLARKREAGVRRALMA
jgi:excisionase family DNA binding protein